MANERLSGVFAAIATAIDAEGAPDAPRCLALARHLLDTGCDGLNVLGTTGEATSFSLEQRKGLMTAYRDAGLPLQRMTCACRRARYARHRRQQVNHA